MGSIANTGRLAAFQSDVFPSGLDLGRGQIIRDLGVFKAANNATILQGQLVSLNADGELVLADTTGAFGVAKWNKDELGLAKAKAEPLVVAAGAATPLTRTIREVGAPGSGVWDVQVFNAAGTEITAAGDFSVSNGVVTWVAVGALTQVADGETVFVDYTYELTRSDYQFQGLNFFNRLNDVDALTEGRLTIIMPPAIIFTTQYALRDGLAPYTVGADLYIGGNTAGDEGMFTTAATGSADRVGRVIQAPTADDPFLGVEFTGVVA